MVKSEEKMENPTMDAYSEVGERESEEGNNERELYQKKTQKE